MKKTALALTLTIVLFSTVVVSQMVSFANANPDWEPWKYPVSTPTITVVSPIESESYPSNDVWLKFTLTKPSDWIPSRGQIRFVSYCVDGMADGIEDENETRVEVQDPLGVVNAPSSLSFSFNLAGLKDGQHTVQVHWEGTFEGSTITGTLQRISFTVYTPFPTALVVASVVLVAVISIGLLVYFKKRGRGRNS
jgi:hypothetical protein